MRARQNSSRYIRMRVDSCMLFACLLSALLLRPASGEQFTVSEMLELLAETKTATEQLSLCEGGILSSYEEKRRESNQFSEYVGGLKGDTSDLETLIGSDNPVEAKLQDEDCTVETLDDCGEPMGAEGDAMGRRYGVVLFCAAVSFVFLFVLLPCSFFRSLRFCEANKPRRFTAWTRRCVTFTLVAVCLGLLVTLILSAMTFPVIGDGEDYSVCAVSLVAKEAMSQPVIAATKALWTKAETLQDLLAEGETLLASIGEDYETFRATADASARLLVDERNGHSLVAFVSGGDAGSFYTDEVLAVYSENLDVIFQRFRSFVSISLQTAGELAELETWSRTVLEIPAVTAYLLSESGVADGDLHYRNSWLVGGCIACIVLMFVPALAYLAVLLADVPLVQGKRFVPVRDLRARLSWYTGLLYTVMALSIAGVAFVFAYIDAGSCHVAVTLDEDQALSMRHLLWDKFSTKAAFVWSTAAAECLDYAASTDSSGVVYERSSLDGWKYGTDEAALVKTKLGEIDASLAALVDPDAVTLSEYYTAREAFLSLESASPSTSTPSVLEAFANSMRNYAYIYTMSYADYDAISHKPVAADELSFFKKLAGAAPTCSEGVALYDVTSVQPISDAHRAALVALRTLYGWTLVSSSTSQVKVPSLTEVLTGTIPSSVNLGVANCEALLAVASEEELLQKTITPAEFKPVLINKYRELKRTDFPCVLTDSNNCSYTEYAQNSKFSGLSLSQADAEWDTLVQATDATLTWANMKRWTEDMDAAISDWRAQLATLLTTDSGHLCSASITAAWQDAVQTACFGVVEPQIFVAGMVLLLGVLGIFLVAGVFFIWRRVVDNLSVHRALQVAKRRAAEASAADSAPQPQPVLVDTTTKKTGDNWSL